MSHINCEELRFVDNNQNNLNQEEITAQNALRLLMMGWSNSPEYFHGLTDYKTLSAILFVKNQSFTDALRKQFQQGFKNICTQLRNSGSGCTEQHNLYISNCLSLLPFCELSSNETYEIPQYLRDEWILVKYKSQPIELTATSGFSRLLTFEEDRVFAYGLTPIGNPNAKRHLIFMGTNYPTGQGHATQVYADLTPGTTPGWSLFNYGRENLYRWLTDSGDKPHVCGMSLGGALALLLACEYPELVERVDALNPPGLVRSIFDGKWEQALDKPAVYIQKQANDPVSVMGWWKKDWTIYKVTPPTDKAAPYGVFDHALNYAGVRSTTITPINGGCDNNSFNRIFCNIMLLHIGRWLFYPVLLAGFAARFVLKTLYNHMAEIILLAAIAVALSFTPHIWVPLLIGACVCLFVFSLCVQNLPAFMGFIPVKSIPAHSRDAVLSDITTDPSLPDSRCTSP